MSIIVRCQCGKRFQAKPHLAGKQLPCPTCGALITVPAPSAPPRPAPTTGTATQAVVFACACGQSYSVSAQLAGQWVQCNVCGQPLVVPALPMPEMVTLVEPIPVPVPSGNLPAMDASLAAGSALPPNASAWASGSVLAPARRRWRIRWDQIVLRTGYAFACGLFCVMIWVVYRMVWDDVQNWNRPLQTSGYIPTPVRTSVPPPARTVPPGVPYQDWRILDGAWQTHRYETQGFSITAPGSASVRSLRGAVPRRRLPGLESGRAMHEVDFRLPDTLYAKGIGSGVGVTVRPQSETLPEAEIEKQVQELTKDRVRIVTNRPLMVSGHPGRLIVREYEPQNTGLITNRNTVVDHWKICVANQRVYLVRWCRSKDPEWDATFDRFVQRFLDSFQLLDSN